MANLVYPKALQQMLSLMMNGTNIKVAAVNVSGTGTLYTYSSAHTFLSDIPGASIPDYLVTMQRLMSFDCRLALGGHGAPFDGARLRAIAADYLRLRDQT